jgi:hypothetical protein
MRVGGLFESVAEQPVTAQRVLRLIAGSIKPRRCPNRDSVRPALTCSPIWAPLTAHLGHNITPLGTNAAENAIRPSKLGAKNWLFVGQPDAGDRPAVIYSLVVSCQRRAINLHDYLRDVLSRLPSMTPPTICAR